MNTTAPSEPIPVLEFPGATHERGLGMLEVTRPNGRVSLPLSGVKIAASVADRVASVTVEQSFSNSYSDPLEAIYIFPLSPGCAVSNFEMKVGARVIIGKVEERGEARQQYQQALDDGKRAALLEQERDDVFTVHVGNLPPGEEVTVLLSYSERLPYFEDGKTEIRLPLVVAPRYIPGYPLAADSVGDGTECDTNIVPDASRISPPRLVPGLDPKVALNLSVELRQAGGAINDLACSQHAMKLALGSDAIKVELSRTDERLDRDFVLRWRLVSDAVKSKLIVHRAADGTAYGMLSVLPPRREGYLGAARDVVFVVDRSGSMRGIKMASAARACSTLLSTLGPRDRFAIQAFDNVTEWLIPAGRMAGEDRFEWADESGIERGHQYLRKIDARGGTEMDGALADAFKAISRRTEDEGRVPVVVVLTDGEVGDESRVLKRIQTELGEARLFTVGIDTAVNDGLLRRVANLGGGTATFVAPGTQLEEALLAVGREIGSPLVVDLQLDVAGGKFERQSLAPMRVPDLYAGRAVTAFFKFSGKVKIRVKGRFLDGRKFDQNVEAQEIDLPAISQLWAKAHITDLEDLYRIQPKKQAELQGEITRIAVEHALLTRFTAFVVIDQSEVVNADGSIRKIVQPVENPAAWESDDLLAAPAGAHFPFLQSAPPPSGPAGARGAIAKMPDLLFNKTDSSQDLCWGSAPAPAQARRELSDRASNSPPPQPSAPAAPATDFFDLVQPDAKEKRKDNTAESNSIKEAMVAFERAAEHAFKELSAGRIPEAEPIERARKELLRMLATTDAGTRVPVLQKFLRGAAVEMIAALKDKSAKPDRLVLLFEGHIKTLREAQTELSNVLTVKASGGGKRFWESSI